MFAGNKLDCFKAMQVLGGPTQILIWGSEIAKVLPDKLRGDLNSGGTINPNYAMTNNVYILYSDQIYKPF